MCHLADRKGVPVWHPTDAQMSRRKWVDLPSTSTPRDSGWIRTERYLATVTEVGDRLSHEDLNPG